MDHPYPKGARVRKIATEEGDGHSNGALGTISKPNVNLKDLVTAGSDYYLAGDAGDGKGFQYFYFVEWDDFPFPVGTLGRKLEVVSEETTAGAR